MTTPVSIQFTETDLDQIATAEGRVAVVIGAEGRMNPAAARINKLSKGALKRYVESDAFEKLKPGDVAMLGWPVGLAAEGLCVAKLGHRADVETVRKAGAALARAKGTGKLLVLAGNLQRVEELALGVALRAYAFSARKSKPADTQDPVTVMCSGAEAMTAKAAPLLAAAEGVFFTRDLVSEPANFLTTTEFALRLEALRDLGVQVEVLEEDKLAELGMGSLLCVGQGSASPSKVVVMQWQGGAADAAPLALVGKGVVFDTGGISLKPAGGMEDMTMDMGGAGVVAGVMKTLALRKAKANVVGLVGLVENMPSGTATRPGDVVTSMKGDTIEVINTDAEGRLVLADVLWYAQERFNPAGMINLATLTGAIIVGLGHENAGVFSNNDTICNAFLKAAAAEGEGAWRMPLGRAYDDMIKSQIADIKNSGGRPAGSITAAQFLKRFVKDETPWIHLDIAGVASVKAETKYAPKGATGWGVLALNRLVADSYES
ncbi:leucyl aminopeptidase [Thalassovita litoralis]|jgi:leucyl aminopeptidase|uniref:Probable cytosol aminopeptidase n=1 Tax=Thalassovita litoralis TaxID=1010611 RepID=A0A521FGJ8_9RHOB|nr:leucyl aminopeptidase [Thalassovita litoralis]SMO95114.1 leucyl aminopeptidase [Thalassovita litoralis]